MDIYIRTIQCDHCRIAVQNMLIRAGVTPLSVRPEKIELAEKALTSRQLYDISTRLEELGIRMIDELPGSMVEQIKETIVRLIHDSDREKQLDIRFSAYLSYALGKSYPQISNIFSTVEGMTVKQFIIQQKVERVMQLLDERCTLMQIARYLNYSSIQHLSMQFKKTTGLTPVEYRQLSVVRNAGITSKLQKWHMHAA